MLTSQSSRNPKIRLHTAEMGTHPLRKQFITPEVHKKTVYNSLKRRLWQYLPILLTLDSIFSSDSVFSSGKQVESTLKITPSQLPKRQTVLFQNIKKPMFSISLFSATGLTLREYNSLCFPQRQLASFRYCLPSDKSRTCVLIGLFMHASRGSPQWHTASGLVTIRTFKLHFRVTIFCTEHLFSFLLET